MFKGKSSGGIYYVVLNLNGGWDVCWGGSDWLSGYFDIK